MVASPPDVRQFAPSTIGMLTSFEIFSRDGDLLTNEGLAGDIASSVGEEINGGIGNITDVSEAAQGLGPGIGSLGVGWEQAVQTLYLLSVRALPACDLVSLPLSGRWVQGK